MTGGITMPYVGGMTTTTRQIIYNFLDAQEMLCDIGAVRSYGEARDVLNWARDKGIATCAGLTIHFTDGKFVIVP